MAVELRKTEKIAITRLEKICKLTGSHYRTNYNRISRNKEGKTTNEGKLLGNETSVKIRKALENGGYAPAHITELLNDRERLTQLWHALYSIDEPEALRKTLRKQFGFEDAVIEELSKITFKSDRLSLSTKAIGKLLPHLQAGLRYDEAVKAAGYAHHSDIYRVDALLDAADIKAVPNNSLRNPVVEKMVNEVLRLVKTVVAQHGRPDEVRVEMARSLRATKEDREKMTKAGRDAEKDHQAIEEELRQELKLGRVSRNDIIKYKLWRETGEISIYTGKTIKLSDVFNRNQYQIEHILPKQRLFDDSFGNKTLAESAVNKAKDNRTAREFIEEFGGKMVGEHRILSLEEYTELVNGKKIKIANRKKMNLLRKEIPEDFINRQLQETRFITKVIKQELGKIVGYEKVSEKDGIERLLPNVVVTTGSITDYLRHLWGLDDVLKKLHRDRWEQMGKNVEIITDPMSGRKNLLLEGFNKRVDHRNHALDALVVACTSRSIIQRLNTLNAATKEITQSAYDRAAGKDEERVPSARRFDLPWATFVRDAKAAIEGIAVSYNSRQRLISRRVVIPKTPKDINKKPQVTYAVRQKLHDETIYGKIITYETQTDKKTSEAKRIAVESFVIRKALTIDFNNVEDIVDATVRRLVQARLDAYNGNSKLAFKDLDSEPIWLNEAKGIAIKKVRVFSRRKDNLQPLNGKGGTIRGYVKPNNNYVFALYAHAFPVPANKKRGSVVGVSISAFDAIQTINKTQNPAAVVPAIHAETGLPLLYTLQKQQLMVRYDAHPDDIDWNNRAELLKRLWVVKQIAGNQPTLVPHHIANIDLRSPDISSERWIASASTFYAVPVEVDMLGNIRPRG